MKSSKLITKILAGAALAFLFTFVATSASGHAALRQDQQQQDDKKKKNPPPPPPKNQTPPPQPPKNQTPPPQPPKNQTPPPTPPPQHTTPPPTLPPSHTGPPPNSNDNRRQDDRNTGQRGGGNPPNNPNQGGNPPNNPNQRGGGNPPNNPNQGGNPPNNPNLRGGGNPPNNPNQGGNNPPNNPNLRGGGNPPNNPNQGGNPPNNPNLRGGGNPPNNPNQGGNPPNNPNLRGGGNPPNNPNQGGNPPNNPNLRGGGNPPNNPNQGGNPPNNPNLRGGGNPPIEQGGKRGGGGTFNAGPGPRGGINPVPTRTVTTQNGATATVLQNGAILHVEHQGTVIDHGPRGERHIEAPIQGGGRVVVENNRRGFVEHTFQRDNHVFVSRTIIVNNRTEVRVYEHERYRGIIYYRYVPAFYFRPAFYGWFFSPWRVGISFEWGWGAWFGFYHGYFEPYPVYTAPNYWLTDYLISENLRLAYENQQLEAANQQNYYNNPPPDQGYQQAPVTLSPEVKQAIADEVARQLAEAQAEAQQGGGQLPPPTDSNGDVIPPALDPQMSTFIVSSNIQVYDGDTPCTLTPGDIIVRIDDTPGDDGAVEVKVTNAKAGDCRAGARPRVYVTDLQDMLNHFRAQIDTGMQQLAAKQGTNGLPPAPAGSTSTIQGRYQAAPDPNAAQLLQQQQRNADAIESQVRQQSGRGGN